MNISNHVDHDTLLLTAIGWIPIVGDTIKDQIAHKISDRENQRIQDALSRLRIRISQAQKQSSSKVDLAQLQDITISVLQRIKIESLERKRALLADILANIIIINFDPEKADWFLRSIDKVSLNAIDVLASLHREKPRHRQEFHSHSGILKDLENKYSYNYLIALLRELELLGAIHFAITTSSLVGQNARFSVFWQDIANEFCNFIQGE